MIIGVTPFKSNINTSVFNTHIPDTKYNKVSVKKSIVDEIYIDEDTSIEFSVDKPNSFLTTTILNAKFKNTLEAGNIVGQNGVLDYILIQKRELGTNEWTDVGTFKLNSSDIYYEMIDKYIGNNKEYEYSLVPVSNRTLGIRSNSYYIKPFYCGMFLSDKDNNFSFLANLEYNSISHINPTKIHQTINGTYPIVTYSKMRYTDFKVQALLVTKNNIYSYDYVNSVQYKRNLLNWLNNGKPKVYRDNRGDIKIVAVSGDILENPISQKEGFNDISISFTEIGNINNTTDLRNYGLIV